MIDVERTQVTGQNVEAEVEHQLVNDSHYAYFFRDIDYEYRDGVLTLRGRLPTFYLKQVLQSRLKGITGVRRIDNLVDVVSSTGLSSVRRAREHGTR